MHSMTTNTFVIKSDPNTGKQCVQKVDELRNIEDTRNPHPDTCQKIRKIQENPGKSVKLYKDEVTCGSDRVIVKENNSEQHGTVQLLLVNKLSLPSWQEFMQCLTCQSAPTII